MNENSHTPLVLQTCVHEIEIPRTSLKWCRVFGVVVQFCQSNVVYMKE